jgi:hypothetical protein
MGSTPLVAFYKNINISEGYSSAVFGENVSRGCNVLRCLSSFLDTAIQQETWASKKAKLRGPSPQAKYTDRATVAYRPS